MVLIYQRQVKEMLSVISDSDIGSGYRNAFRSMFLEFITSFRCTSFIFNQEIPDPSIVPHRDIHKPFFRYIDETIPAARMILPSATLFNYDDLDWPNSSSRHLSETDKLWDVYNKLPERKRQAKVVIPIESLNCSLITGERL